MSIYQTYRPENFDEFYSNDKTIESLKGQLSKDDPPHAYLFIGPTGCGKTTLGRITAKELGVVGSDFREVDSADFRGIDTIREIRTQSRFKPIEGIRRAWLLDECHKLTNDAQNALLKALEDSPRHVYYILATTEPNKLLGTVRSRCSQFTVAPLDDHSMFLLIRSIVRAEKATLKKPIYKMIIKSSQGRPREALQILDQVLHTNEEYQKEVAELAAYTDEETIELCRALIKGKSWKEVSRILDGLQNVDPETIRRSVLGYCKSVLLHDDKPLAGLIMDEFITPFYDSGFPEVVLACYRVITTLNG